MRRRCKGKRGFSQAVDEPRLNLGRCALFAYPHYISRNPADLSQGYRGWMTAHYFREDGSSDSTNGGNAAVFDRGEQCRMIRFVLFRVGKGEIHHGRNE